MAPFFRRYRASSIALAAEDVLAPDAVYAPYLRTLRPTEFDEALRPHRRRALAGALDDRDFRAMQRDLDAAVCHAQTGGLLPHRGPETPRFAAYARVNTLAMLTAQVLFVDNAVREGLPGVLERDAAEACVDALADRLADTLAKVAEDAFFYATLFTLQVAFDRLFVPDESVVRYTDADTGAYAVTDRYEECTAYLELSNRKVLTASDAEKALCTRITTGWSEGIDRATWDLLNTYYYSARSPTTGEENLFVKNYDVLLERMLPQFGLSKVKLAEELVARHGEDLHVLEIGAGSGAFAIDLAMACLRLGVPVAGVAYRGVEPSEYMRRHFRDNISRKIGTTPMPDAWTLVAGSLEAVHDDPDAFLAEDGSTVVVFSFSLHHCFGESVEAFFRQPRIRERSQEVYVLEGTREHGWTKPFYMWVDCESPENFDNVVARGDWEEETLWTEPSRPLAGTCVTLGWSCLRRLR